MQPGSIEKYHSSLGCKLTGGMFSTQGPVLGAKSSFVIAGRYIDFSTLSYFMKDRGTPRIGDLYIKGIHLLNDRDDISATGLLSYNSYTMHYPVVETDDVTAQVHENVCEEQQKILQGGCGITYRAPRGFFSNKAVFSCSFRDGGTADSLYLYSDSFFTARYSNNPFQEDRDARYRVGLTINSDAAINTTFLLSFGARSQYQQCLMNTSTTRQYQGLFTYCNNGAPALGWRIETPRQRTIRFGAMESAGFGELTAKTGALTSSLGVRADYFHLLHAVALSPRLSMALTFDKIGAFLASCGIQHQFPSEIPSLLFYTYSMVASMDDHAAQKAMVDVMNRLQPLRCYQASLGFSRWLTPWMRMQSDAYFKWYDRDYHFISPDQQEVFYFEENNLVLYPQNGRRKAYGIEGALESPAKSRLRYSMGASLFTVKNQYRDGTWYDDWTNVGYTLSLSLGMNFLNNNYLSLTAMGNGGRPYCPQVISEDCIGRKTTAYASAQNYYTEKLDPIFSANVKYTFRKNIGRATVELFVEALNALNSQPTLDYRFNGEEFKAIKPYGIIPIVGAEVEW
jgi:hypothetical protein